MRAPGLAVIRGAASDGLEGAGDLGDADVVEQADRDVPEGGHDLRPVPGVPGICVFG
jgi:hypothetical protein